MRLINNKAQAAQLPVDKLRPFEGHPFRVKDDSEMDQLVYSILTQGLLTPISVRPVEDNEYEVISGHRRLHACKKAGIETVPALIYSLDRDAATIAMVDSNLHREKILPSEKAFAYKLKRDAMSHQGKTFHQVGEKLPTAAKIGIDGGDSMNQVLRYIRLTELIPEILTMVDDAKYYEEPSIICGRLYLWKLQKNDSPCGQAIPHFRENPLHFIDASIFLCYNLSTIVKKEAFSMENKPKKTPCCTALLAHVDAGKTTLSEALLYTSGARRQMGRVDHRDAFLDTHDLERSRGITIFSKLALMQTEHLDITLVDTPGHVDFAAEAERTMYALDCAVLVINGTDGVQAHTLTLWELLRRSDVPTFLFINKMDLPGKSREELLKELQEKLSEHIVDFGADHDEIAEAAAVCDEALLEQYLETGEITDANLRGLIGARKLFPCCFGSALKLQGVEEFLDVLDRFAPEPEYLDDFGAHVYKITRDPQGVRLTWMKIIGGSLKVRAPIPYRDQDDREYTEKCIQLRRYSGAQFTPIEEATAGMIVAVQGLSATYAGQPLGAAVVGGSNVLEPVMSYRLNLPPDKDPLLFLPKLRQLEEEDPQLRLLWDERLRQIHVSLMGKVQLEILTSLILERFGVNVTFDQGRISYKETIENTVEGVGHFEPLRHYAECHLLLEPLSPGSGIVIDTKCSADVLDWQYQKLIISHISEKQHLGVLTGSPITDIAITLMAGRAHLKHTEGGDFRQATYRAVRQGLMQAKSRLLEPWYEFTLTVPTPQIGRAITDIRAMSGEFDSPEAVGGNSTLRGTVPVSEVGDYAADVAAYTHGTGIFQTRLLGYRPCHNEEAVVAALGYDPEADLENTPDSVFCAHGAGFNVKWNEVPNYMHIASVLEKPKQPELVMSNYRMDDKELEIIMEREFGPAKRRQYTAPRSQSASDKMPIAPPREHLLIIDGYNVLFNWPELGEMAKIDLGLARNRLIEILGDFAAFKNYRMVLVFDGYRAKGNPGQKSRWEKVEIVYTKEGQTGDAYIESLATRIGPNYATRVVTSDSLVQLSSFRSGLLRMSARELRESVENARGEIRDLLTRLQYSENRRFHEK